MAIPTSTQHVDGTAMDWSIVAANLAAYRAWQNAIPLADLTDGSIRREHLVRPVIDGFPFNGIRGETQQVYFLSYGVFDRASPAPLSWGQRRNRITITPPAVGLGEKWRTPIGATVRLPYAAHVEISLSMEWQVRNPPPGGPIYPDGAGAGNTGGYFAFLRYERATDTETEMAASRLFVYPLETAGGTTTFNDRGHMLWAGTLAAGTWDLSLAYVRGSASVLMAQIDVSRLSGKIVAHM